MYGEYYQLSKIADTIIRSCKAGTVLWQIIVTSFFYMGTKLPSVKKDQKAMATPLLPSLSR